MHDSTALPDSAILSSSHQSALEIVRAGIDWQVHASAKLWAAHKVRLYNAYLDAFLSLPLLSLSQELLPAAENM